MTQRKTFLVGVATQSKPEVNGNYLLIKLGRGSKKLMINDLDKGYETIPEIRVMGYLTESWFLKTTLSGELSEVVKHLENRTIADINANEQIEEYSYSEYPFWFKLYYKKCFITFGAFLAPPDNKYTYVILGIRRYDWGEKLKRWWARL